MLKGSPAGYVAGFVVIAIIAVTACSSGRATGTNRILVVDKVFDLKTADPHRELSVTGGIVAKALYNTLMTFDGGDDATPSPSLARTYYTSDDATRYVFKLRRDVMFADGTPLTSTDVAFSFDRLAKVKSPVSSLLAGVNTSAPDPFTVLFESKEPKAALPFILTNPALAIVNSTVVKSQGEDYLSNAAAGSGPYMLTSFSASSDIQLTANPRYWGPKPFYSGVVIRNIDVRTQLTYIANATDQIALDLTWALAGTLSRNQSVATRMFTGSDVVFLFANESPQVSPATSNKHFQNAVRYALDYDAMVQLAGAGAIQATGVIPSNMLGALPVWAAPRYDIDKAKAELVASGLTNPTVNLGFANDQQVGGLPMSALASMIRSELGAAGIQVKLAGGTTSAATADYSAGTQQMGLWSVMAASADPNPYLAFLPGGLLGLRAGWPAGADPSLETLGVQAATTPELPIRAQLFQLMQGQLNAEGPFFPLLQPGRAIVATKDIATIQFNPIWSIDLAAVSG